MPSPRPREEASKLILLVEDNAHDEELTMRTLRKANAADNVVVTRDGAEALDFLFARGEYAGREGKSLPAVVLLDLTLPKVDGFEVLRRMRADERTRRLPVVVLTSSDRQRDRTESFRLGANDYVRKPLRLRQFLDVIPHLVLDP